MRTDFIESCRKQLGPCLDRFGFSIVDEQHDCPEDGYTCGVESVLFAGKQVLILVSMSWGNKLSVRFVRVPLDRAPDKPLTLTELDSGYSLHRIRRMKSHQFMGERWYTDSWDKPLAQIKNAILESADDILTGDLDIWEQLKIDRRQSQRET